MTKKSTRPILTATQLSVFQEFDVPVRYLRDGGRI